MKMGSAVSIFNRSGENGHKRLFSKPILGADEAGLPVKEKAARYFIREGMFRVYPADARSALQNEGYNIDFSKYTPDRKDSWANKIIREKMHGAVMDMVQRERWDALVALLDSGGLAVSPPKAYRDCAECRKFWFNGLSDGTGKEKPAVSDYLASNLRWLIRHYGFDSSGPIREFSPQSQDVIRKNMPVYADRREILRMGDDLNAKLMKKNGECTADERLVLAKLKANLPLERRQMYPSITPFIRKKFTHELFDSGPSAEDFNSKLEKYNKENGKKLVFRFNSRRLGFLLEKIAEFPLPKLAAGSPIAFVGKGRGEIALPLGEKNIAELGKTGETCLEGYVLRQMGKILEVHCLKEGKITWGTKVGGLDYFLECAGGRICARVDALRPLVDKDADELVVNDREGGTYLARRECGEIRIYKDDASVLKGMYKPLKSWNSTDVVSGGYGTLLDHHTLYWHLNFGFAPEGQEIFKSAPDMIDLYEKMDEYNSLHGTSIRARLTPEEARRLEKPNSLILTEDGKYKIRSTKSAWLFFETFEPWEMTPTTPNVFASARLFASESKSENKSALEFFLSSLPVELQAQARMLGDGQNLYVEGSREGDYRITRGKHGLEAWSDRRGVIARAVLQLEREHGITDPRNTTMLCFKGNDGLLLRAGYVPFMLVKLAHPELLPEDMKFPPKLPVSEIRGRANRLFEDWAGWFAWKYPNVSIKGDPLVDWEAARQAPTF